MRKGALVAFDWRHYIHVKGPGERDAHSGALVLSERYAAFIERSPDLEPQIMEMLKQQEIIEAELDVAAGLPGFQEDVIRGASLAHDRLDTAQTLLGAAPRDDARLVIEVGTSGSSTEFFAYDNSLVISPYSLVRIDYVGEDGQQHPFSLLQAIVHEVGHFGDPKFSAEFEQSIRHEAYGRAIDQLLQDFPEYRDGYEEDGVIAGLDFKVLQRAENFAVFDEAMSSVIGYNVIRAFPAEDGESLRDAYERSLSVDNAQEIVQQYFRTVYQDAFDEINERELEHPIIERTYEILSAYDPDFPKRADYEAVHNDDLGNMGAFDEGYYERVTELLAQRSVAVKEGRVEGVGGPVPAPVLEVAPPMKP